MGWVLISTESPYYVMGWRVALFGAEEPSNNTMELMAIVESLERCGAVHVTLYSDSAYAVQGSLPSLPRRVVRFQDRALWRRLQEVVSLRTSLGLTTDIIKCSAHGRNADQAPHFFYFYFFINS